MRKLNFGNNGYSFIHMFLLFAPLVPTLSNAAVINVLSDEYNFRLGYEDYRGDKPDKGEVVSKVLIDEVTNGGVKLEGRYESTDLRHLVKGESRVDVSDKSGSLSVTFHSYFKADSAPREVYGIYAVDWKFSFEVQGDGAKLDLSEWGIENAVTLMENSILKKTLSKGDVVNLQSGHFYELKVNLHTSADEFWTTHVNKPAIWQREDSLSFVIPEPASLAIFAAGLLGINRKRKRKIDLVRG